MANPGDKVKVIKKEGSEEGIFVKDDKDTVFLKLGSGYNVGIDKKKITKVEVLEKGKGLNIKHAKETKFKKGLPTISILHTGGTIASKVDYRTGAVIASFDPEDLVGMFPELNEIANIDSELVANMWSDDLRFKHFEVIAKAIEKHVKKGVDGVIIGIGTDNLAVAAAALSFAVEETPIPIILVGAQRSSDRGSSDAAMNLVCAAEFIVKSDFAGVAICMHYYTSDEICSILPACKTKKLHSSRRDAFKAVNDIPIAKINYKTKKIELIKKINYKKEKRKLVLKPKFEEKVGLIKVHVNMFPEQFEFFKGYKGLIIEGTGLGHTPGHVSDENNKIHEKFFPAIKKVIDSGCLIVMTSNTLFGRVNMNVYNKGVDLQNLGVIPGEDMIAETALVKLAWLLGNYSKEDAKDLIRENIKGEINERIEPDEFLE